MTIVREPMWDDAPRTRAQGAFRYLARFLASLGWAARILVLSVAAFPSVLCRRSGRADFATQLYVTGIRTLPVIVAAQQPLYTSLRPFRVDSMSGAVYR